MPWCAFATTRGNEARKLGARIPTPYGFGPRRRGANEDRGLDHCRGSLACRPECVEAGDFSLRAKLQPTYTDTVDGPDDFYLRGNIEAAASGTFAERFNYEFDAILSSERYYDLSLQNVDYAIAEALIDTTVAGFTGSLSATAITVLAPFYAEYEAEIVDLGWSVNRSVALGHGASLIPGFAVTRRLADTPGPERVRFSPSMELDLPLWGGVRRHVGEL